MRARGSRAFLRNSLSLLLFLAALAGAPFRASGSTPLVILGEIRIGAGGPFPADAHLRAYISARPNETLTSEAGDIQYNPVTGLYQLDLGLFSTWLVSEYLVIEAFDAGTGSFGQIPPTLIQPYNDNPNLPLPLFMLKPSSPLINRVGDVNLDGYIDSMDLRVAQNRIYGLLSTSALGPGALANADGLFDLRDLMLIAQRVKGARSNLLGPAYTPAQMVYVGSEPQLTDEMVDFPLPFFVASELSYAFVASKIEGLAAYYFVWPPLSEVSLGVAEEWVATSGLEMPVTVNATPASATFYSIINLYDSEGSFIVSSSNASVSLDAVLNVCGDNYVGPYEACDDGGVFNGDGCDFECKNEFGFCGDGVLTTGEACDDGDPSTCGGACAEDCSALYVWTCGDGVLECGEACDDGNLVLGDGCDDACAIQPAAYPFIEDFESTALPYWRFGGQPDALEAFDTGDPYHGSGQLSLGAVTTTATAHAELAIDLAGQSGVRLRFAFKSHSPFGVSLPNQFVGSAEGDGVSISRDGVSWRRLIDLSTVATGVGAGEYAFYDLNLDEAVSGFGWAYDDDFRIRFQHTAYDAFPAEGGVVDWVELSGGQCGDGQTQAPEACDDGDEDNCTTACDALCAGPHVVTCGDGVAECGETCDDGDADDCTPTCDAVCAGPYPLVCGDGIQECGEGCDDANTTPGDGCDEFCQPECAPLTCPSTPSDEQIANREDSFDGGFAPGGWIFNANAIFNGANAYYSTDTFSLFTGDFDTFSDSETFYVWFLGYRSTSPANDRSMEIKIDGDAVGVFDDSGVPLVASVEWQYIGSKTLAAGPHSLTVRGMTTSTSFVDGVLITTDPAVDPQIDYTPLTTFNLDDPALDYYLPGSPLPECCGDCTVDAGETCDDGNLVNGDGCSDVCLIE